MNNLELALELQKKAYDGLEKLKGEDFSPRDVLEYLRVGVDLERKARFSSLAGKEQEDLLRVVGDMWAASDPKEAGALFWEFWDVAGKMAAAYKKRFSLDKPPANVLDLGRQIYKMREEGTSREDICKALNVKRGQYYYLLAEYMQSEREALEDAER